jgi:hypothetical protein
VGWYQVRKALEKKSDGAPYDFMPFKTNFEILSKKLVENVYDLGFLRR